MKISMSPPPLTALAFQGFHANIKDTIPVTHTTVIVSCSQTTFFFLYWDGEKGSGTSNSKFLFGLIPELGWAMIGDD